MDPFICCLLGICCPPFSDQQHEALLKLLTEHLKDEAKAKQVCDDVFGDFAKATQKLANAVHKAEKKDKA